MIKIVTLNHTVLGDGTPKICVPVVGRTQEEICRQAVEIAAVEPDLVEWRVDFYEDIFEPAKAGETLGKLTEILKEIPVLFTFRSSLEGGEKAITAEAYFSLNVWAAAQSGISMVDVEGRRADLDSRALVAAIHEAGTPVVVSNHFFHETPATEMLDSIFEELEATGADILKLAVMPQNDMDVIRLLEVTTRLKEKTDKPVITMSMGKLGVVSRVCGSLTGSAMTFGTVGAASAPGQLPVKDLRKILGYL
ncbi:MAG: type I 3-dehydroquinate dehydratase [Lachnospiraceae bacterium]|nr:type I 3-dehydroquinate dehydratase [Lachnospiraceae bacterium]